MHGYDDTGQSVLLLQQWLIPQLHMVTMTTGEQSVLLLQQWLIPQLHMVTMTTAELVALH